MIGRQTHLEQVRAITANFFFWQGLRWVPLGLAVIIAALDLLDPGLFGLPGKVVSLVALVVALWISTTVLGGYYRRHFGRVRMDPELHARRESIKWMIVYPAMLVSMIVDMKLALPMLITGVVWGASIEAYRRSTGGGRNHYVIAAVAFGVAGVLPLFGLLPSGKAGVNLLVGLLGAIYVVGGILDHRALVSVLGPAED